MIYFILSFIFFILFLASLIVAFYFIYKNFENIDDLEIEDYKYNSIKYFFDTLGNIFRFFLRRLIKFYKFLIHYFSLIFIKILDVLHNLIEKKYQSLRNSFVRKSVKNKAFVVHFWKHLKTYKREIDEEENNLEKK